MPASRDLYFRLDGHTAVAVSAEECAFWNATTPHEQKIVRKDQVGEVEVSTVFLMLNHQHLDQGKPLVFETMVFGGELNSFQRRYSTWEESELGHAEVLARVLGLAPGNKPENLNKPEPPTPGTKTRFERIGED